MEISTKVKVEQVVSPKCHASPTPNPWGARGRERRLNSEPYNVVRRRHPIIYAFLHKFRFLNKLAAINHGTVKSSINMVHMTFSVF